MTRKHLPLIRLILLISAIAIGGYLVYTLRSLGTSALVPAIGFPLAVYLIFMSLIKYLINLPSENTKPQSTKPENNIESQTVALSGYSIGCHSLEILDYESGISDADFKNLKFIRPENEEHCIPNALNTLGPRWSVKFRNVLKWGVPVKDEFIPKAYYFKGPVRPLADFQNMYGIALVSQKFKDLVESLEPHVHQFFPVQCYWPRKKPIEDKFYFFHVCNALDSVNGGASGFPDREVIYSPVYEMEVMLTWKEVNRAKTKIFNLSKVGNCHIWQDKFLVVGPWGSSSFRQACKDAKITGISMGDSNRYGAI